MISKNTVFILGAGASSPYGLPLGKELVDRIVHELNPGPTDNKKALECISQAAGGGPEMIQLEAFRQTLEESRERSIDAFLEHHTEFMNQGKRAIAWILLNSESSNARLRPSKPNLDWYPQFRDMLSAPFNEFQNNKAAVLTFNYDRSLEQFLFTTLSSRQRDKTGPDAWAAKLRESLPIVHLHGELGKYPEFADVKHNDKRIPYGFSPLTFGAIRLASESIRNVHDKIDLDADPAFQQAYRLISQAESIFFMGFRYDERNVKKLRLKQFLKKQAKIFGSGLDLTEAECARVQRLSMNKILAKNILPVDCVQFLRQSYAVQTGSERR